MIPSRSSVAALVVAGTKSSPRGQTLVEPNTPMSGPISIRRVDAVLRSMPGMVVGTQSCSCHGVNRSSSFFRAGVYARLKRVMLLQKIVEHEAVVFAQAQGERLAETLQLVRHVAGERLENDLARLSQFRRFPAQRLCLLTGLAHGRCAGKRVRRTDETGGGPAARQSVRPRKFTRRCDNLGPSRDGTRPECSQARPVPTSEAEKGKLPVCNPPHATPPRPGAAPPSRARSARSWDSSSLAAAPAGIGARVGGRTGGPCATSKGRIGGNRADCRKIARSDLRA